MSECLFCRIIAKEIPAKIEYEDKELVVIQDINPQAPVHLLIISKKHVAGTQDMDAQDRLLLGEMVFRAKELAHQRKLEEGYRWVLNKGAKAGQSVFHIHLHFLAGRKMNWPPG